MDQNAPKAEPQADAPKAEAPKVNVDQVAEAAAEAATKKAVEIANKLATDKLKKIGLQLAGQPEKDEETTFLEEFAKTPRKAFRAAIDIAKSEINSEHEERNHIANEQRAVLSNYVNEYPEIQKSGKLALISKLTEQNMQNGASHKEALDSAVKETIKEFNLKSVSELQKEGNPMGLPRGGGYGSPQSGPDLKKSSEDFFTAMRNKSQATKVRKT